MTRRPQSELTFVHFLDEDEDLLLARANAADFVDAYDTQVARLRTLCSQRKRNMSSINRCLLYLKHE